MARDHAAEARYLLSHASDVDTEIEEATFDVAQAQVHALLHLGDKLDEIDSVLRSIDQVQGGRT